MAMLADTCLSSVEQFFEVVRKSGLLDENELQSWKVRGDLPSDARALATMMVKENALSRFQGNQLLLGKYHGFIIGPYRILRLANEGAKDAVFVAEHRAMNRQVALKIIKSNESKCQLTRERFMREARITAKLNHPNIVKVYDFAEEDGQQCLIMEHVEGQTLQEIMNKNGSLPYQKAIEYICHAAAGLQHAHDQGIIHRGIKPSNMIYTAKGLVKISDMGHSRFSDAEEMNVTKLYNPTSVVGSVDYVAPEQALGEQYDARCDIYSLGVTLYALIAGRPPFQGTTYQVLMAHQLEEAPPLTDFQPGVPRALQTILNKMMAKQAAHRYQTVDEVITALTNFLANRGSRSTPKVPTLPSTKALGKTNSSPKYVSPAKFTEPAAPVTISSTNAPPLPKRPTLTATSQPVLPAVKKKQESERSYAGLYVVIGLLSVGLVVGLVMLFR